MLNNFSLSRDCFIVGSANDKKALNTMTHLSSTYPRFTTIRVIISTLILMSLVK
jgi:hypothetical protein